MWIWLLEVVDVSVGQPFASLCVVLVDNPFLLELAVVLVERHLSKVASFFLHPLPFVVEWQKSFLGQTTAGALLCPLRIRPSTFAYESSGQS